MNHYGSEMVYSVILGEITGPLMNLAEILENIEKPKKELATNLKKVFMVMFIIVRAVFCFKTMVNIQRSEADLFFKFLPTLLWVLSMKWVWAMFNKSSKLMHLVSPLLMSSVFYLLGQSTKQKYEEVL